jgi:hypothetical protein
MRFTGSDSGRHVGNRIVLRFTLSMDHWYLTAFDDVDVVPGLAKSVHLGYRVRFSSSGVVRYGKVPMPL